MKISDEDRKKLVDFKRKLNRADIEKAKLQAAYAEFWADLADRYDLQEKDIVDPRTGEIEIFQRPTPPTPPQG